MNENIDGMFYMLKNSLKFFHLQIQKKNLSVWVYMLLNLVIHQISTWIKFYVFID